MILNSSSKQTLRGWFAGMLCAVSMFIPHFEMGASAIAEAPVSCEIVEETPDPRYIIPAYKTQPIPEVIPEPVPEVSLTSDEFNALCIVAMAEAGNQDPMGIRLVIDTILNRVDHSAFPNDVLSVIYQKNQFTSMWDGNAARCYVRDDIAQLVKEECMHRTNRDAIFFRTGRFSDYGTPMYQHGDHYFSSL